MEYSLLERGVEREVLPACAGLGLGVLAWSPLGRGVLTGKYRHGVPADSRGAPRRTSRRSSASYLTDAAGRHRRGRGDRGRRASAPRRSRSRWPGSATGPGVAAPIVGARTVGQLPASLAAEAIVLPAEIRARARRRVRAAVRLPGGRAAEPLARRSDALRPCDPVFAAFCAAGLWPGLGQHARRALPAAGIAGPEDVTAPKLAGLPKVGTIRAGRLLSAFDRRRAAVRGRRAAGPGRAAGPARGPGGRTRSATTPPAAARRPVAAAGAARRAVGRGRPGRPCRRCPGVRAGRPAPRPGAGRRTRWPGPPGTGTPCRRVELVAGRAARRAASTRPAPARWPRRSRPASRCADGGRTSRCRLSALAMAEDAVAEAIARLHRHRRADRAGRDAGERGANDLDEAQRGAVDAALRHGVSVLTGGPGTGKSRTVAALVALRRGAGPGRAGRADRPGGQAAGGAVRRAGDRPCTGCSAPSRAAATRVDGFARGEEWPLDEDARRRRRGVACSTSNWPPRCCEACADGTHLLLVGDPAQLPSIGPGRVLGRPDRLRRPCR